MPTFGARGLDYVDRGEGPPTLFVHGFPLDRTLWDDQVAGLTGTRRCLAVDLRGYGRSVPVTGAPLTMESHADDLAALLESTGAAPAHVVALSMGGYVALALWEQRRDLVASLVLADTRAGPDGEEARRRREETAIEAVGGGRSALADQLIGVLLSPGAELTARARLRSMVEGTRYETIVAALRGMAQRPDRTGLLETIDVPALVLVGEEDALTPPEDSHEMATSIPGASFRVIPGAGHLPPIERPDEFTAALTDFYAD